MELKQKLALTETNITEGRTSIRGIARKLHHLKRECEGLVTKEELAELESLIYRKYFKKLDLLAVECSMYLDKKFGIVRRRDYYVATDEDINTLKTYGDKLEKNCYVVVTFGEIEL